MARKRGRPPGRSIKMIGKLKKVQQLNKEKGIPIVTACKEVGISPPTFYSWEKEMLNNEINKNNI